MLAVSLELLNDGNRIENQCLQCVRYTMEQLERINGSVCPLWLTFFNDIMRSTMANDIISFTVHENQRHHRTKVCEVLVRILVETGRT